MFIFLACASEETNCFSYGLISSVAYFLRALRA